MVFPNYFMLSLPADHAIFHKSKCAEAAPQNMSTSPVRLQICIEHTHPAVWPKNIHAIRLSVMTHFGLRDKSNSARALGPWYEEYSASATEATDIMNQSCLLLILSGPPVRQQLWRTRHLRMHVGVAIYRDNARPAKIFQEYKHPTKPRRISSF
jgi:hypothetical protein